jgi:hypothetical protein
MTRLAIACLLIAGMKVEIDRSHEELRQTRIAWAEQKRRAELERTVVLVTAEVPLCAVAAIQKSTPGHIPP